MTERIVAGVVQPPGAGGGRAPGEEEWTLSFSLQPWRISGSPLVSDELHVYRVCGDEALHQLQDQLQPYRIIRARVRLGDGAPPSADLVELLGEEQSDSELIQQAHILQQPVTCDDPLFGVLTLDRSVNWWRGSAARNGTAVRLTFTPEAKSDLLPALELGRQLWADQAGWQRRIVAYAVQELLTLKNESWLEPGERKVSPMEFASRISLEAVSLYPDGSFVFWYDDGDLFWGHSIRVCGSADEGLTDADIAG